MLNVLVHGYVANELNYNSQRQQFGRMFMTRMDARIILLFPCRVLRACSTYIYGALHAAILSYYLLHLIICYIWSVHIHK